MARVLHPVLIRAAVERLGISRASKSFLHVLIFKRTMVSSGESVVSFSVNNSNLLTAVDELGACAKGKMRLGSLLANTPYLNIFGSAGATWQYLRAKWRTNGTGVAISGAAGRGVVDLVGERPRNGKLANRYVTGLGDLLLKAGSRLPSLVDAAIWFHRADDLNARFGTVLDSASLAAKRFLILSGLSGSGKTKIAHAVARWLTPAAEEEQSAAYAVIPVGADWTGNNNILGYPDGLDPIRYVTRPALDLIQRAGEPEIAPAPEAEVVNGYAESKIAIGLVSDWRRSTWLWRGVAVASSDFLRWRLKDADSRVRSRVHIVVTVPRTDD